MQSEKQTLYQIGRTLSWEDGVLAHFSAISKQSKLLRWTSFNGEKDTGEATKVRHRTALLETLEDYRGVVVDQRLKFLIEAYLEMEIYLSGEWFRTGCNPSAEVFASYYLDCIPTKLYNALQLPKEGSLQDVQDPDEPFSRFYPKK